MVAAFVAPRCQSSVNQREPEANDIETRWRYRIAPPGEELFGDLDALRVAERLGVTVHPSGPCLDGGLEFSWLLERVVHPVDTLTHDPVGDARSQAIVGDAIDEPNGEGQRDRNFAST